MIPGWLQSICLNFHQTSHPVRTASLVRVREPIIGTQSAAGALTTRSCATFSSGCRFRRRLPAPTAKALREKRDTFWPGARGALAY